MPDTKVDVKTAVRKAIEYVREFQDYFPITDVRLEETEFVEPASWHITLSFSGDAVWGLQRNYKILRIDANTGDVVSMKIRAVSTTSSS
jgi:hypothetical protein